MKKGIKSLIGILTFVVFSVPVFCQTTEFTYQGDLQNGGVAASGSYDFEFLLFDAVTGGAQTGSTLTRTGVTVTNGIFSVKLDFGANFPGANRFLELHVRQTGGGAFTPLAPRHAVTSAPHSVTSLNAGTADTATNFSGILFGDVSGTQSATYVDSVGGQSATNVALAAQLASTSTSSNTPATLVWRDGNGDFSARIIDVSTQYNIGGFRVLGMDDLSLFAGVDAGTNNSGNFNTFVGQQAGYNNTSGSENSFFGLSAGAGTTTGIRNSIFGRSAGLNNSGSENSSFGTFAGFTGTGSSGSGNSYFGYRAAGGDSYNTYIGYFARNTGSGSASLVNSTAIGANSAVSQSNSLVLGSINGINGATADTNVGIGTTGPKYKLHVSYGTEENLFVRRGIDFNPGLTGMGLQSVNESDSAYKPLDLEGSQVTLNVGSGGNVGIGTAAPAAKLHVSGGSVYITNPSSLIITSPNGACWFITVNNAGALSTISVTCP